jgi:hypothetical protein
MADRAIVFVSKDENLTNAHARHLEKHLTERIGLAGRSKPKNSNGPGGAALPEADVADMDYFLDQIEIVLPVLGLDVLRPIATAQLSDSSLDESPGASANVVASREFELNVGQANARAVEIDGDFIVKSGSIARDSEAPTFPNAYRSIRARLKADGSLTAIDNQRLVFTRDVPFNSPSAAASVVYGASMSGPANWIDGTFKQTYADYRQNALSAAEAQGEKLAIS